MNRVSFKAEICPLRDSEKIIEAPQNILQILAARKEAESTTIQDLASQRLMPLHSEQLNVQMGGFGQF